jgi:hypothetical protein
MRKPILLAALLLAGCGPAAAPTGAANGATANGATSNAATIEDDRIECRLAAASQFERFCTIERADSAAGRLLTLRKPDGGFRRLLVATDGRGVVAADGAEPARVTILRDGLIEVEIGGDRFRLPARVRSG